MRINFKTIALIAVLCLPVAGCQKEQVENPMELAEQTSTAIKTTYSINGVRYSTILEDETAWDRFINEMLALTREGYEVTVARGESQPTRPTKEKITYTTYSEQEANLWVKNMTEQGYTVDITYDSSTGLYTCVAYK